MSSQPQQKKLAHRLLELLPATFSWVVILSPVWGGLLIPEYYAYFIIFFNVFWFYKSITVMIFFLRSYFKIRQWENTNWRLKLDYLLDIKGSIAKINNEIANIEKINFQSVIDNKTQISTMSDSGRTLRRFNRLPQFMKKWLFKLEKSQILRFMNKEIHELSQLDGKLNMDWRDIKHIVIMPFVQEGYEVLRTPVERLANQTLSSKNIILVLATEKRKPLGKEIAEKLVKEFGKNFHQVWITQHEIDPDQDEIVGKGSNMYYAGRFVQNKIEELGWDKSKLTISSMDCDSQFDYQYFAALAYRFVTVSNPYFKIYHAPMIYYANYWRVPFFVRVANTGFSIISMSNASRDDKNINVSTYSTSFKLMESIGFWSPDVIPEDYHVFYKALFLHGDKVSVIPIYLKTLSDAAGDITLRKSAINQYEQVKRWAWGVSDTVWMVKAYLHSKKKTPYVTYRVLHTFYDFSLWSTTAFLLLFGANIPPVVNRIFGDGKFGNDIIGIMVSQVSSLLISLTLVTLAIIIIFDYSLKPNRPNKVRWIRIIFEQLQWLTFPIIGIFFGALPGLDSQTRLFFGKYLEYRVTEKRV